MTSGVAVACAGCAMHKDPGGNGAPLSGIQWNQVFCFPMQNVVKSTEIYGFLHVLNQQLHALALKEAE